jgi:hypothetical protein
MARRSKMHRPITLAASATVLHDRRATDVLTKAEAAPIEVVDPFGDRIVVLQNLRDDPLAGMLARKQIDRVQYRAGQIWQEYMEATEIGGIKAIDPTKEAVDGGRFPDPLTDKAAEAFLKLREAHATLGMIGENIIRDVLGSNRMTIKQAAAKRYCFKVGEIEFWGKRFREALDTLAVVFGCATGGR